MKTTTLVIAAIAVLLVVIIAFAFWWSLKPADDVVIRADGTVVHTGGPEVHGDWPGLAAHGIVFPLTPTTSFGALIGYRLTIPTVGLGFPLQGVADTGSINAVFVHDFPDEAKATEQQVYGGGATTFHIARITVPLNGKDTQIVVGGGLDVSHLAGGQTTLGVMGLLPFPHSSNGLPPLVAQLGLGRVTLDFRPGTAGLYPDRLAPDGATLLWRQQVPANSFYLTVTPQTVVFADAENRSTILSFSSPENPGAPAFYIDQEGRKTDLPFLSPQVILDTGTTKAFYGTASEGVGSLPEDQSFLPSSALFHFADGAVVPADLSDVVPDFRPLPKFTAASYPFQLLIGINLLKAFMLSYTVLDEGARLGAVEIYTPPEIPPSAAG